MKKLQKTICLLVAFVFCILTVSGCALFERDVEYYNNLIVARVGNDIKITKKQLINGFNSFGYQYMENGMTQKQAINETLNNLIDREIMVELSIKNFSNLDSTAINELRKKSGTQGLYYQALNEYEKAEVRKNTFDGMDTTIKEIEKEVRSERKQSDKVTEEAEEAEAESESNAFNKYEPYIIRSSNNSVFKIDVSKHAEKEMYFMPDPEGNKDDDGNIITICTVPEKWTPKFRASTGEGKNVEEIIAGIQDPREKMIAEETYARLVRLLRNSEKGLSFSKNEDADVVSREIDRLIEGYAKNVLYSRYNECFEQGINKPIDRSSAEFRKLVADYGSIKEAYERAILLAGVDTESVYFKGLLFNNKKQKYISTFNTKYNEFYNQYYAEFYAEYLVDMTAANADKKAQADAIIKATAEANKIIEEIQLGENEERVLFNTTLEQAIKQNQESRTNSLVDQAIEYYKAQVKTQVNRYKKGLETDESLGTKIMEGLADTYWLPNSIIDNYFTVSHILIGYSDEQTELISKKKEELKVGGITNEEFQNWLEDLDIIGKERGQDGKETGITKTAAQILNELQGELGSLSESNSQNRINTFRDYIYRYNTDPGMMNAEYEYVIGVNESKMVEQFTSASRELYGYEKIVKQENGQTVLDENNKPVYEWKKRENYTPVRSAMSGLVITEYGAHIIMYTRPLRDFIQTSTTETDNNNYQNFLFKPLTSYGDTYEGQTAVAKTYFDSIIEKLNKPAYENYEQSLIVTYKQARAGNDSSGELLNIIKINKGNYKDLF